MEHFSLESLGFKDYSITKCGKVYSHISNKHMKPSVTRGYLRINIYNSDNGKKKKCPYSHVSC